MSDSDKKKAPAQGDWVQVWAQVADQGGTHPEDLLVRFWSHNADYKADVRKDHVQFTGERPLFWKRCTSLKEAEVLYRRCILNQGHADCHEDSRESWDDRDSVGYFEEA